jgi:hypothetical protein
MRGNACAWCDRRQSVWEYLAPREAPATVCSFCLLYAKDAAPKEEVDALITQIETSRNAMFDRDAYARLMHCADADRVMGVLVLTSRVMGVRERSAKMHGGSL